MHTFVLLNGEMAIVSTCFRKLKFWLWLHWTVFFLKQTGFLKIYSLSCIKRPTKKLIRINRTKYNIFVKSGYFVKTSKNCIFYASKRPFLDGKVLPNSFLSMKIFHACALEYGHDICNFIFWYLNMYHFREVTVLHSQLWTY